MNELYNGCELQNGRYRIEKKIGSGGFGITYKGKTSVTITGELGKMNVGVDIAIKEFFMNERCVRGTDGQTVTVPAEGSHQQVEKYKKKFISEAQKLAKIEHTNIVSVTDVFEEHNTVYYVMRYLSGGSLADLVKKNQLKRLSEEEAIKFINQIGNALSYLHSQQICHFDVKPQNILLDEKGNAVLIDFGISKTFTDDGSSSISSSISYTNRYAPIEQYNAMTEFSPQTDLYSLGATMYYLLTGEAPAEASTLYENGFPERPYFVSLQIWEAIKLAMRPTRKERPKSVAEWLNILNASQDNGTKIEDNGKGNGYEGETVISRTPPVRPANSGVKSNQQTGHSTSHIYQTGYSQTGNSLMGNSLTGNSQTGNTTTTYRTKNGFRQWLIIAIVAMVSASIGSGLYMFLMNGEDKPTPFKEKMTTAEAIQKLGSTDITYEEVLFLANNDSLIIHNGSRADEDTLMERLNTVGQIYMEFMKLPHDLNSLVNAYNIKAGFLSSEQIKIMIWFMNKSKSEKAKWTESKRQIHSFKEFRDEMHSIIGD